MARRRVVAWARRRKQTRKAPRPPSRRVLRPGLLDLLLRHLEQLPLGVEARALNRLGKLDPLHVVDLAELRRQLAAGEHHQIEVDALADQRSARPKEVLDRVER